MLRKRSKDIPEGSGENRIVLSLDTSQTKMICLEVQSPARHAEGADF